MTNLLRDNIELNNINNINAYIQAYTQVLDFYEKYIEEHSLTEYLESRVQYLNSQLAEYMIARELAVEKSPI